VIKRITLFLGVLCFFLQAKAQLRPCTLIVLPHVTANTGECTSVGSATLTIAAGAYTFSWSTTPVQTTLSATGLSAGTYTITVTNTITGCTGTASVTITAPPAVTASPIVTNAGCASPTGSINANASSGVPAYTYLWSPGGQFVSTATGLSAGSYTVTVTDAAGCSVTASATVGNSPGTLTVNTTSTNAGCVPNGTATANITAGSPPYTYSWNTTPIQTNATATGLSAGSYTVTVTDPCATTSSSVTIIATSTTLAANITHTNAGCNPTGTATAHITSGTPPYTYSWSTTPIQTSATATGLSAGSYTVTMTDACSTTSSSVTITAAGAPVASAMVNSNTSCSSPMGNATASATGGATPYTYLWSPSGGNSPTASNLSAGNYTVTVTDANNCSSTASVSITAPSSVVASAMINNNASACANSGNATGSATSGSPPYTYSWAPSGGTNATASNLSAGSYTVTVTDNSSCSDNAQITITAPAALSQTNSSTMATCGGSNGTASVVVSGGNTPYTYSWSPSGGSNATASNLSAATYTVLIQDADLCSLTAAVIVSNAPGETITFSNITDPLCRGASTGSAMANVSGGSAPYTYSWAPSGGANAIASNLSAATYTVTVHDANNCPATASVTITQPAAGVSVTTGGITNLACSGDNDGSAIATPAGGTTPYNYVWTPMGGNSPVASNLTSGTYTITVTDAGGCSASATATINSTNPSPVVSFMADTVKGCAPMCTEFKDLSTISSGTIQSWAWNFGNGITSAQQDTEICFNNTGAYNVGLTVTSNMGCSSTIAKHNLINVFSYPVAAFTFGPQPTNIMNPQISFADKSTDAYGISGWLWTFGDLGDSVSSNKNTTHTYIDTGTYCATLRVTNTKGCTDSTTQCLIIQPQFTLYIPSGFSPNGDELNDVFKPIGEGMESYTMNIFNRWGNKVFTTSDIKTGWNGRIGSTPGPQDVYIYDIEVVDNFGNAHSYIGEVALLQ